MGGDADQPLGYVGDTPPTRVISLNARDQAPSSDIEPDTASFDRFADDVIDLADQTSGPIAPVQNGRHYVASWQ